MKAQVHCSNVEKPENTSQLLSRADAISIINSLTSIQRLTNTEVQEALHVPRKEFIPDVITSSISARITLKSLPLVILPKGYLGTGKRKAVEGDKEYYQRKVPPTREDCGTGMVLATALQAVSWPFIRFSYIAAKIFEHHNGWAGDRFHRIQVFFAPTASYFGLLGIARIFVHKRTTFPLLFCLPQTLRLLYPHILSTPDSLVYLPSLQWCTHSTAFGAASSSITLVQDSSLPDWILALPSPRMPNIKATPKKVTLVESATDIQRLFMDKTSMRYKQTFLSTKLDNPTVKKDFYSGPAVQIVLPTATDPKTYEHWSTFLQAHNILELMKDTKIRICAALKLMGKEEIGNIVPIMVNVLLRDEAEYERGITPCIDYVQACSMDNKLKIEIVQYLWTHGLAATGMFNVLITHKYKSYSIYTEEEKQLMKGVDSVAYRRVDHDKILFDAHALEIWMKVHLNNKRPLPPLGLGGCWTSKGISGPAAVEEIQE
ncbi:uncharacterized protein BDR25DRAFT_357862 [Lindgomyces ingoldianus]|uniref:Uncharacterized protein n=1 Tax=Lindgomyces ingoldianus TaxID=673940 RepID=A0ACB6QPA3_9PLEO|nr:uncharacterized protein BDR25DRAFT_357862 [Lindgomyces ingoldianus]KAF2468117.1 hypothetical protein BDR25DRAFT_357862 [Lindgomyces ingoldianus]